MSYDVSFEVNGVAVEIPRHTIAGGAYAVGGTTFAELNITYNYGPIIRRVLDGGIGGLHGKTAADVSRLCAAAAATLSGSPDPDYWAATEGNSRKALRDLHAIAAACPPDAICEVY